MSAAARCLPRAPTSSRTPARVRRSARPFRALAVLDTREMEQHALRCVSSMGVTRRMGHAPLPMYAPASLAGQVQIARRTADAMGIVTVPLVARLVLITRLDPLADNATRVTTAMQLTEDSVTHALMCATATRNLVSSALMMHRTRVKCGASTAPATRLVASATSVPLAICVQVMASVLKPCQLHNFRRRQRLAALPMVITALRLTT
mmetsp:Transcript_19213/g.49937  ORF Transcript_19213/g.49937 Transcript_19213/m.49937 type:complete len:207 (+) Transcript_19213:380-1000(+)